MTPDEITSIERAFAKSVEPLAVELRNIDGELVGIHGVLNEHARVLNEHTRILNEHTGLLRNVDMRLVRVEGILRTG